MAANEEQLDCHKAIQKLLIAASGKTTTAKTAKTTTAKTAKTTTPKESTLTIATSMKTLASFAKEVLVLKEKLQGGKGSRRR
jgi:hypothetical protein